jgi:pilus assembly protein CpaE
MRNGELIALLVCPDRDMAKKFADTQAQTRTFQVVADLKAYPNAQALELRVRQTQPDVILIDVATDLETATQLIAAIPGIRPGLYAVGIHHTNEPDAIVRSLRAGASEFLHAPFDEAQQREAVTRLNRLRAPEVRSEPEFGRVIAFASTKPGSGASTLATQTAFALKRRTNKRILLIDFDLMGGTIGFYLKLNHPYSLLDAVENAGRLNQALWSSLIVNSGGVDILPAPEAPFTGGVSAGALHEVMQFARVLYDWVVLDLPAIFQKLSLQALPESEVTFLVSTSELPSLHLARKAAGLMQQLNVPKEGYQMVVNRISKRDNISSSDLEKIFNCSIEATFPNDYFSLHRVVTLGQPLGPDSDLGKAIEGLTTKLTGGGKPKAKSAAPGEKTAPPPAAAGRVEAKSLAGRT